MIKRLLSILRRPTPEEIARDVLRDLLSNIDKVRRTFAFLPNEAGAKKWEGSQKNGEPLDNNDHLRLPVNTLRMTGSADTPDK